MIRPILQYRPLDRGFIIALPGSAEPPTWQRVLRGLPGNLHGRDRLTPAERHILSTATVVDDAPAPADENAASLATMAGFLGAIGGAK